MHTTGKIADLFHAGLFDVACVDVNGIGGGVVDRLAEQGIPIVPVNTCESASSKERYHRLRDELWWLAREWFSSKLVALPPRTPFKNTLIGELTTPDWRFDSSGKVQVRPKDGWKKNFDQQGNVIVGAGKRVHSPNIADALIHTFVVGIQQAGAGRRGGIVRALPMASSDKTWAAF